MFALAHLSDPHLAPLPQPTLRELAGKRCSDSSTGSAGDAPFIAGTFSTHWCAISNRRRSITSRSPATSSTLRLKANFAPTRAWLQTLGTPSDVTLVPGNHDFYVRNAAHWPSAQWGDYMRSDSGPETDLMRFPFVRRRGNVALIGLSSGVPTAPFMATGWLGDDQLRRLADTLHQLDGMFRVVLIHHPLAGIHGRLKRLTDAAALRAVLAGHGAELLLHGHDHVRSLNWLDGPRGRIPAVGVPSASALAHNGDDPAGYNIYRIDGNAGAWRCEMTMHEIAADGTAREIARQNLA